jgi:MFS family permease
LAFIESFRGLPRTFWFLWTGTLINRLGTFVVPFIALFLTQERGLSVERTGLIVSLFGAGQLGAGLLGGYLADRIGRRPTMLIGLLLGPASLLWLASVRSTPLIALATFSIGLFGDLYRPATQAALADLTPSEHRGRVFGLVHWAVNIGFAVAPVIAGFAAAENFEILFVADAATTLAFAAIVALFVPETRAVSNPSSGAHISLAEGFAPFRDSVFMAYWVFIVCVAVAFHQSHVALPLEMASKGLGSADFGVAIASNGAAIVLIQPFALRVLERSPRSRVLAASAILTGLGFGLSMFATTVPTYIASILIWTLGEISMAPVAPAIVADLSPERLRGTYQGAFQMAWGASSFAAPALGSWMLGRFGGEALWSGCAALGGVAAIGQLSLERSIRSRSRVVSSRTSAAA